MIKMMKNTPSSIVLSTEFIENLQSEDTEKRWAVMIFEPSTQIIRTIPTSCPTVIKLYIELTEESGPNILVLLGEVLARHNINTLYSYFICHCPDPSPYVGYIDSTDSPISEDQLKSELLALPIVTHVKLTKYSL